MFVITGGGTGIGRALTIHLAVKYEKEVLIVGRTFDSLKETQARCPARITPLQADITVEADRQKIVESVSKKQNCCLIHSAGIAEPSPLAQATDESLLKHMQTNCLAPIALTRALLTNLQNGRVLFISSGLAHNAGPGMAPYGMAKAALVNAWKNWQAEAPRIAFGMAQPGMVDTPIQDRLRQATSDKLPMLNFFQSTHQRGQLLKPEVAAKFFAWLLLATATDQFVAQEWNIYDKSHWQHWAAPGEVVLRDSTASESRRSQSRAS